MPTSSACIRPGSASIISTRSACCPAPIWCSPISRRGPSTSASRPRSPCCRCTIRSASPSNGRRSICCRGGRVDFAAGRGYDRREYAAVPRLVRGQPGDLRGGHGGRAQAVDAPTADLASRQALPVRRRARSRRSRCSSRCRPMSPRSRKPSIELAGAARLRPDRRAVRRGDDLRRARSRWPTSTTRPAPSTARSRAG